MTNAAVMQRMFEETRSTLISKSRSPYYFMESLISEFRVMGGEDITKAISVPAKSYV
jgi:hypothetical protein